MYLFVFGLLGPITKGENSGGENHLDPKKQPDRPSAALDCPQLSRAASRSPSLESSQVKGHDCGSEIKCCDTGQIEDTRQKRLQMLGRAEVTQTLSHWKQSSQYINNSKGILM